MTRSSSQCIRRILLPASATIVCLALLSGVLAAPGDTVQVRLDASQIQPRPLEQLTGQAIVKT